MIKLKRMLMRMRLVRYMYCGQAVRGTEPLCPASPRDPLYLAGPSFATCVLPLLLSDAPPRIAPIATGVDEKRPHPAFTRFSWIGDGYSLYSRFSSVFLLKHFQWDLMNAFHRIFHSLHRMLDWEHIGVFSYKPHMCWVLEYVGDRRRHLSSWKSPIWTHKSVRWSIFSHLLLLKIYPQKGWGKPTKIHMFVLPEYTASFVRFSC